MDWEGVLGARVLFVSGKGGTGKSTVAAALATAAAGTGRRTILVEVEGRNEIARTLDIPEPGYAEASTPFGFEALSVTPREASLEYLRRYYPMARATRPLATSAVTDQVIGSAPGFRDLLVCGKVYELGRTRRPDGDVEYDLVVVDAPPTGQIVPFLGAPDAFAELIRMGRMRRHASTVATFLRRYGRVVLVALPEEMAVRETLEALPAVTRTRVAPVAIVANRCSPPAFPVGVARAARRLTAARLAERVAREGIALPEGLADALIEDAHEADARHRSERSLIRELAAEAPLLELADVPGGSSRERVRALAGAITGSGPPRGTPGGRTRGPRRARPNPPAASAATLDGPLAGARIVVVCGSGGVGKTTVSAAVAIRLAESGRRTALLTVDPARRLATALRLPPTAGERTRVGLGRGRSLEAMQLDTKRTFDELVERFAGSRERRDRILGNAFYRRIADTLGGTHEYMAMEKLHQLAEEETHDAIVIDTPPTRSALSFLDAPGRLTDFLGGRLLRWMLRPSMGAGRLTLGAARLGATAFLHAAGRLVGSAALADLAEFLAAFEGMFGGFEERASRVVELLQSDGCAFLVVTAPAGPSLEEAGFFLDRLAQGGMRAGPVVVNRWRPAGVILPGRAARASSKLAGGGLEDRAAAAVLDCRLRRAPAETEAAEAMAGFAAGHPDVSLVAVPDLSGPVLDVPGLRRVGAHLFGSGVR